MSDVLHIAEQWLSEGRQLALATVIETWGSAPQPVGSQLVIDSDGNFMGAVSGGCVEGDVITQAQDAIATGKHALLNYGVADETAWKVGLACGGKIRILVEPVR
jgi:xanthine/CO dehydrogenase XdhC/CoxF family maturation factor